MDLCLIIDTSMFGASIAIIDLDEEKKVIWQGSSLKRFGSAAALSQLWSQAMVEGSVTAESMTKIAVSSGPGSFTGIKVGLSWAFGFAACKADIEWLPISSLECAAWQLCVESNDDTLVLLPCTKTHGFAGFASKKGERLESFLLQSSENSTPLGPLDKLCATSHLYWGDSWEQMTETCKAFTGPKSELGPTKLAETALSGMLARVSNAKASEWTNTPPAPRYLRQSTAEEKLERQKDQK